MKKMKEYFDEEAAVHDELFVQKLGLAEFYDAVEQELNKCINKGKILVLGCGSGLEIERIKFPSAVTGVDISEKMLEVLKCKKLSEGLQLTTICASFLDLGFEEDEFDIVLSCYVMHHFNERQKLDIYKKIYRSLKKNGIFINGDSMAANMDEEEYYRQNAEKIYQEENLPFASLHIDAPFCWIHEKEVLTASGFTQINLVREWTRTKLYHCIK